MVYVLSLGVYATAWTFYGSIGKAARSGNLFLAIYLGLVLAAVLFWPVLGRIIRIARRERIHSIAARYSKSTRVGMVVAQPWGSFPFVTDLFFASYFLALRSAPPHTIFFPAFITRFASFLDSPPVTITNRSTGDCRPARTRLVTSSQPQWNPFALKATIYTGLCSGR